MSLDDETLTISPCPKCGDAHIYRLEITRSYSMSFIGIRNTQEPGQTKRSFTRLFICPVTQEHYQARFQVVESSDAPIKSVEIDEVVAESANEHEYGD